MDILLNVGLTVLSVGLHIVGQSIDILITDGVIKVGSLEAKGQILKLTSFIEKIFLAAVIIFFINFVYAVIVAVVSFFS